MTQIELPCSSCNTKWDINDLDHTPSGDLICWECKENAKDQIRKSLEYINNTLKTLKTWEGIKD